MARSVLKMAKEYRDYLKTTLINLTPFFKVPVIGAGIYLITN